MPVSFIPYEIMHGKWQYHLLTMLRQYVLDPAINTDLDRAWRNYPRGYRVVPRRPFAELFRKSFGKDPLLCPRCGDRMQLELIHHPDYGTIKDYGLFGAEVPLEQSESRGRSAGLVEGKTQGNALGPAERMGQVLLPFL